MRFDTDEMRERRKRGAKEFQKYLAGMLDNTDLTQKEIAEALGYDKSGVIAMIKAGKTKLPIPKAPALAKLLGLDPGEFTCRVLDAYMPDLAETINDYVIGRYSDNEHKLVQRLRRVRPEGSDLKLTADQTDRIVAIAREQ
jgi:transcriptional regulator with XRE-family HTH domain